ncbi:serine/threonine-protein kinase PAK 2-like isoform X2 [Tachypleus tridentatus]|uniref:serine/threonine-protein kinase PAK 2-like isoform X2 n=1 Tax=Tachypleus tridentatus TaxID=6853 RepID=UPI003FD27811
MHQTWVFDVIATNGKHEIKKKKRYMFPVFPDFLDKCLEVDIKERHTASELLKHPFMELSDQCQLHNLP